MVEEVPLAILYTVGVETDPFRRVPCGRSYRSILRYVSFGIARVDVMMNAAMFTSNTDEWATPRAVFEQLDAEFHFTVDVCATAENAKCKKYYTKEQDGLKQEWRGVCWMNPPYGREIGKWIRKAYNSARGGATVVCLIPSQTDTRWFQDYCLKSKDIRFIRGRLRFGGAKNSAPFPSAIIVFSPKTIKEEKETI